MTTREFYGAIVVLAMAALLASAGFCLIVFPPPGSIELGMAGCLMLGAALPLAAYSLEAIVIVDPEEEFFMLPVIYPPYQPRFHYDQQASYKPDTSESIIADLARWFRGVPPYSGVSPEQWIAKHGHAVLIVSPGDGTSYQCSVQVLDGAGIPGRPVVAFSFLNTYRSAGTFGPVDLNVGDGRWLYAHEVQAVGSALKIDSRQVDGGVCAAAHVAAVIIGLVSLAVRDGVPMPQPTEPPVAPLVASIDDPFGNLR